MATNEDTEARMEVSQVTDVVCPECHSDNYMEVPEVAENEYRVLCLDCGQEFTIRWVIAWEPTEKGGDTENGR